MRLSNLLPKRWLNRVSKPRTITRREQRRTFLSMEEFERRDLLSISSVLNPVMPVTLSSLPPATSSFSLPIVLKGPIQVNQYLPYSYVENGVLTAYSFGTGVHHVYGAILAEYQSLGDVNSFLGYPTSEEEDVPGVSGARVSHFENGDIYWAPGTGAHEIHGAILAKFNDQGGAAGYLGLPLTDETGTPDGLGRYNHFEGGSIYWTPDTGAHAVRGAIRDEWASVGWEQSLLGYPVTDEYTNADNFQVTNFQNGSIVWRGDVGTHLSFSRDELLRAVNASEADGVLDGNEYQFLKTCADDPNVYMTWANHNLLQKMIDGNRANAFFQGTPVGNLTPGAPAWMEEDLKQKWFEGADLPYASDQQNNIFGYAPADGVLFGAAGPSWTDVKQGLAGDCYFMAALEEVTIKHPDIIQNMITDNGDGTFTVQFFNNGAADYVTVNRLLPVNAAGQLVFNGVGQFASLPADQAANRALWADLVEKAYAQVNEEGWIGQDGTNSYNGIPGTKTGGISSGYANSALGQITNWPSNRETQGFWPWSGGDFADSVGDAYRNGLCVVVCTPKSGVGDNLIVPNHCYALIAVSPDNQTFVVANPWGVDANGGFAMTTLTRDQFINSFDEWDDV